MKTKELLDALTIVKPGLSNKEIIEQANAFAFMDGKVVTYNDQISVSHPVEGLAIDRICVPGCPATPEEAQALFDALKKEGKRVEPGNYEGGGNPRI